jgi:transposase
MLSSNVKYIGLDVHKEAIAVAVLNGAGKLVAESIVETKASTLLDFLHGQRGELHVTLEEGTWAAWLYDLLKPHVREVVVCNPRRNALLKEGSKSDKVDARKLAELLRSGMLRAVYHGENGLRALRELARTYQVVSKDLKRVMSQRHREQWLKKIGEAGVRRRAELFYQQLDALQALRHTVRGELLAESRKHQAVKILRQIPSIGPLRAAQLVAVMQTPHRFRSKRQLWTYSGLAVETHDSSQYRFVDGQLQRSKKPQQVRGLNQNHNHAMKEIFKSAALSATRRAGPFQDFYEGLLAKGMKPELACLTLARKIAATTLTLWKKGECFDARYVKPQAA